MEGTNKTTEMGALKARLHATWTDGDFGEIAKSFERGAAELVVRQRLQPGSTLLDVACGNGNTAIPAALSGVRVTGIDIAPYLIEQARDRARREGAVAVFEVGDAEAVPYPDDSFDTVLTMFGAMFAPRPEVVVSELVRVCRPGGAVVMANWTPEGFIGEMFKVTGRHVPPPASMPSPLLWGNESVVAERFAGAGHVEMNRPNIEFYFPFGPSETVEHFRKFYGPTKKAFEALQRDGQERLRSDLVELWSTRNAATDGTTSVLSEYVEVRVVKNDQGKA